MGWFQVGPQVSDITQYLVPVSAGSVACNPMTTLLFLNNSSLLATYTVTLPQNPVDGQRCVIAAAGIITLLTVNGGTVKGLITTLAANGWAKYNFSADAGAWFRTG